MSRTRKTQKPAKLVPWGVYEPEAAAKEAAKVVGEGSGGAPFLKIAPGRTTLRILPPKAGANSPFVVVHQHYITRAGNEPPFVFVCPRHAEQGDCPACNEAARLRATGNKLDREQAWQMMPKVRGFANVIDRNDEEAGPKVWGIPKTVLAELTELRQDEDAGGDFTDPEVGFDVIVDRTGTGKMDTSYSVRLARKASPITEESDEGDALMMEWYEAMSDLSQFAKVKQYREISAGMSPDDDTAPVRGRVLEATAYDDR